MNLKKLCLLGVLVGFSLSLNACLLDAQALRLASKEMRSSAKAIRKELKEIRGSVLRKDRKLEASIMIALVDSGIKTAILDLRNLASDSINKSKLAGLRIELELLKSEIAASSIPEENFLFVNQHVARIELILTQVETLLADVRYDSTRSSDLWDDWFKAGVTEETRKSAIYATVQRELHTDGKRLSSKQARRLNAFDHILEMRSDFEQLFAAQVGKSELSDGIWGNLKYSAVRSMAMADLAYSVLDKGVVDKDSIPQPLFNVIPGNEVKMCKLKKVNGDEAGTANGGASSTVPAGSTPPASSGSVKCEMGSTVLPPPPPKPA